MEKIALLRKQVVIGIRHAKVLLDKTNGDVAQAMAMYEQEMISAAMEKAGVDEVTARKHLELNRYDLAPALSAIEEELYPLGVRIMKRYSDKKEALQRLSEAVDAIRTPWLDVEDAATKHPVMFCLLVIEDWFAYDNWEGFDSAVFHNTDIVTAQIAEQLQLTEVAETIREAHRIYVSQRDAQWAILQKEGAVTPTPEFVAIEKKFLAQLPLLIDALYAYVNEHLDVFK
jgi:hypothetical protein